MIDFPVSFEAIMDRVKKIEPRAYGHTRNYIDGAVTYLSPYISRGVISTRKVWEVLKQQRHPWHEMEKLVQELAWRDYFQWVAKSKDVNADIKQEQYGVKHHGISDAILWATTGIRGIDDAIKDLYETGYMHNHCRMYVASLACNLAGAHWKNPAQWMYYHLLDGDWASNACSWQWVAGSNSSKKYYANQENISKFTKKPQKGTYLDVDTEALSNIQVPDPLMQHQIWHAPLPLQEGPLPPLDAGKPLCIYTHYNLDPLWRKDQDANRVLLLDTQHLQQYPVGPKVIEFIKKLAGNISDIRIYVGSFQNLMQHYGGSEVYFKEHPLFSHFRGNCDDREWMTTEVKGYHPSFFAYWKKVEKVLQSEL